MNTIEISNVSKSLGGVIVLDNVTASFAPGAIHGIIGRNGSGKTVLFKCICGFSSYDAGEIAVAGKVVGKDVDMPKGVGVIIETPGFLPHISGARNLRFLGRLSGTVPRSRIGDVMRTAGLDPESKKHVGKYSLGMRQRLGIAQALLEDPSILVLDEPFNGLDKEGLAEMRELFLTFKSAGKTVLIASHSSEDIGILCDTVHEIEHGRLHQVL